MEEIIKPGDRLSADALNRGLLRNDQNTSQIQGMGHGNSLLRTGGGELVLPEFPRNRLAQITGIINYAGSGTSGSSGSNPRNCQGIAYSWGPVDADKCGQARILPNIGGGDATNGTAFEANGNSLVPINTVVMLWEAFNTLTNGTEWLFWFGIQGGSGGSGANPSCADCLSNLCIARDANGNLIGIFYKNANGTLVELPNCQPPISGSGSGGGGGGACCGCIAIPIVYTFTLAGVANGTCILCPNLDINWRLTQVAGGSVCSWSQNLANNICFTPPPGFPNQTSCRLDVGGLQNVARLRFFLLDNTGAEITIASYTRSCASWSCLGANSMALEANTGHCANWPAVIVLTPG